MLLQKLREYAEERLDLPPPMYQEQSIRYFITLRNDGSFAGYRDTASSEEKALKNGLRHRAPHVKRSSGIRPKLLADNASYVLGIAPPDGKADRVRQQHAEFVALVDACSQATGEPSVGAVAAFLGSLGASMPTFRDDFDPAATITFEVGPELELPIDLRSVQRFWATRNGDEADADPATLLPCIVCGELRPALERHPLKIKGVPGGQILKDLISANAGAFESYGLKASLVAPTCQSCAEAYGNALNALLADRNSSLWMKEGAYAFWTRAPSPLVFARLITEPAERQTEVKSLLESWKRGTAAAVDIDPNPFYAVGLGASGARLVVEDWIDTTVGEAKRRIGRYFALQEMVEWDGSAGASVPIFRLTGATVRDPRKDEPAPIVSRSLIRLALLGNPLPMDLLYLAVRRNRAEQDVTRERAMLIKMVLMSQPNVPEGRETTMSELEQENTNPAYLCGRLLATLDQIQSLAIPGANAGIVDKFYGSASSAPASVFGTLLHGTRAHLSKLERDRRGAYIRLEQELEAITLPLQEFPMTLTLQEQGLFALGFYHQRAANRKAAKEAKARNDAASSGEA